MPIFPTSSVISYLIPYRFKGFKKYRVLFKNSFQKLLVSIKTPFQKLPVLKFFQDFFINFPAAFRKPINVGTSNFRKPFYDCPRRFCKININ